MLPNKNKKISTVLLAVLMDSRTGERCFARVSRVLQAQFREKLERGSTALAVSYGEYLACYDSPADAARAAASLQDSVEESARAVEDMRFVTVRTIVDVWPSPDMDGESIEQMRTQLAKSRGQGVILTGAAHTHIDGDMAQAAHRLRDDGLGTIFELDLRQGAVTYREATRTQGIHDALIHEAVELSRRDVRARVTAANCPFTIGRDQTCGMMVGGNGVSRFHGTIHYDSGVFYYEDTSRNGTYLLIGGNEVYVNDARFPLSGNGAISPSSPLENQTGDVLRYRCEASKGLSPQAGQGRPSIVFKRP